LAELFKKKLVDFVAMDIKNSPEKYHLTIGQKIKMEKISKSIELIQQKSPAYEFRTTVVPKLVNREDIGKIGQWLAGSKVFVLQQFRGEKTLDTYWQKTKPYPPEELEAMAAIARPYFEQVFLRNL